MKRLCSLLILCGVIHSTGSLATTGCTSADGLDRPKIGLVLGGGGARGISHIGVIRELERLKVPVDYVAGTSMGSIVGGLYATGMNSQELEAAVQAVDWKDIFVDETPREDQTYRRKRDDDNSLFGPKLGVGEDSSLLPAGAVTGQKITLFFQEQVSRRVQITHFDELPIPFRAVAADVVDGSAVIIESDDLAFAMRSSMSIPGIFAPVQYRDHILVDGGIAKNLPVDVVRNMGADIIIAIDVGTPLKSREELTDLLAVTGQLSGILVQRNTMRQRELLTEQDVLILPELGREISSADFTEGERAIEIGLAAGRGAESQLSVLGIPAQAYARHRAGIQACVQGIPTIEFATLDNRSRFADDVLEDRLNVALGQPLDAAQMEDDLAEIYALGFLDRATYEVVEEGGRHGVNVIVEQDSRGTNFLETGGSITGSNGSNKFELRLAYLKTDIDDKGSELRAGIQLGDDFGFMAELYKLLDNRLNYIVLPKVTAERKLINIFDDSQNKLATYKVKRYAYQLAFGRELGDSAAVFAGIAGSTGELDIDVGPPVDSTSFNGGKWFVSGTWDTLDNRFFPSNGLYANASYSLSREDIGADEEFEQLDSSAFFSRTFGGRHNLMGGAIYQVTLNGAAPIEELFTAGGFFRMSGFEPNELSGQHFGMALLGYRYKLADIPLIPPYLGTTLEYGNTANKRDDIIDDAIWNGSIYAGVPTILGPVYLGYGWRENDSGVVFLRLGTLF